MSEHHVSPWYVDRVGEAVVERLATLHSPNAEAVAKGVDLVGDPHREDDAGHNWTRLRFARSVPEVVPGSAVLLGSGIGTYLAKVVAVSEPYESRVAARAAIESIRSGAARSPVDELV